MAGQEVLRVHRRLVSRRSDERGAIDTQSVKTAEDRGHGAEKKIDGRKRRVIVDADGLPLAATGPRGVDSGP